VDQRRSVFRRPGDSPDRAVSHARGGSASLKGARAQLDEAIAARLNRIYPSQEVNRSASACFANSKMISLFRRNRSDVRFSIAAPSRAKLT
jgi:hypothetical protein